jgi:DNA-binding FrmR family transcriptional regulator
VDLAEQGNPYAGRAAGTPKVFKMKIQTSETKKMLIQRLKRIEGQVRGVQNMLDEERDCREIMQQLTAVHSAVQSTSRIFLQEYATSCLAELDDPQDSLGMSQNQAKRQSIVRDMITMLDKTP